MKLVVTSDIFLRKLSVDDAADLYEVVRRNLEWFSKHDFLAPSFSTHDEARQWISVKLDTGIGRLPFGLWHDEDLIGLFKVNSVDKELRIADVGYWLTHTGTGKGYAGKALRRLVVFCLDELKVEIVRATTSKTNTPSIRLLERVGFKQKTVLPGHVKIGDQLIDDFLYEIVREDLLELGKV